MSARPLRQASRVRIVAPSGPFDRPSFEAGLALLQARYVVSFDEGIYAAERYLAGPDVRRRRELSAAMADPSCEAVFCARGGYGAMRLLDELPFESFGDKPLVGFSDVTALHAARGRLGQRGLVHGPVLTQLAKLPQSDRDAFFSLLESAVPPPPLEGEATLVDGAAEGPLVGGNLSVFTRLLGTPYLPPLEGAVLLLEDVGERPYRLDRMWTHLRLAGVFAKVKGVVFGDFTGCEEKEAGYSSADVLAGLAREVGLPTAAGFGIGHGTRNRAVPLGARVRLDATAKTLIFLEGAFSARSGA